MASTEIELCNFNKDAGVEIGFSSGRPKGRKLCITVALLATLSISLLIALVVVLTTGREPEKLKVCYTESCYKTAKALKDSMDTTINPCEDFYGYCCGKWINSHKNFGVKISEETLFKGSWRMKGYLEEIEEDDKDVPLPVREISKMFKVCSKQSLVDIHKHYGAIQKLLSSVGGWPLVTENWSSENTTWTELFPALVSALGFSYPLTVSIFRNPYNTSENIFAIGYTDIIRTYLVSQINEYSIMFEDQRENDDLLQTPIRGFPANKLNPPKIEDKSALGLRSHHIIGVKDYYRPGHSFLLSEFLYKRSPFTLNDIVSLLGLAIVEEDSNYIEERENLYALVSQIAMSTVTKKELFMVTTIENLDNELHKMDWVLFLNKSFDSKMKSIHTINKQDKILVFGKTFLSNLVKELEKGTFGMRLLINVAVEISLLEMFIRYTKPASSKSQLNTIPRYQWMACLDNLIKNAGPALDYVYGRNRREKLLNETTITYLFRAMKQLVEESTWLDGKTKEAIYEKLEHMVPFLGFPGWTQDPKQLEEYYKMLPKVTDNPLENEININLFESRKHVQKYTKRNDRKIWQKKSSISGSSFNAFYHQPLNQIFITAAIQVPPYFSDGNPQYMNFGALGAVIGHEITHGFDKQGSERDFSGNLRNWWSNHSKEEFERRSDCLIKQYNEYVYTNYSNPPTKVNGLSTLSENIADNGGLREAFRAYKMWEKENGKEMILPGFENYSPYQLFFISFARMYCDGRNPEQQLKYITDVHAPDKARVIGCLSNMKEFSDAFSCKKESPMNPENKCIIW